MLLNRQILRNPEMCYKMLLEASAMGVPLCCGWYILTTFSWYRMVLKATNTFQNHLVQMSYIMLHNALGS
jgi:hypothetical protein